MTKNGFDINRRKNKSLADLDNLQDPDELTEEIIENLQSAVDNFDEMLNYLVTNNLVKHAPSSPWHIRTSRFLPAGPGTSPD